MVSRYPWGAFATGNQVLPTSGHTVPTQVPGGPTIAAQTAGRIRATAASVRAEGGVRRPPADAYGASIASTNKGLGGRWG